ARSSTWVSVPLPVDPRPGQRRPGPWRSALRGQDDDPAVGLLADGLRRDAGDLAEREVDPAALEGGHGLQLDHPAGLVDPLGCPLGELLELPLAATAIVLDVDQHPRPLPGLPGEEQVHEMLERGQALALAPDERAQGIAVGLAGDDVEPARLALADLDRH